MVERKEVEALLAHINQFGLTPTGPKVRLVEEME